MSKKVAKLYRSEREFKKRTTEQNQKRRRKTKS